MSLQKYISENFLTSFEDAYKWAEDNAPDAFDWEEDTEGMSDWQLVNMEYRKEELVDRIQQYIDKFEEVSKENEITIYRMIAINSVDEIDMNNIGVYWSFEWEGAGVYGDTKGAKEHHVILAGKINPDDIDWEHGFVSFLYYGDDQWECALNVGATVTITDVYVENNEYGDWEHVIENSKKKAKVGKR